MANTEQDWLDRRAETKLNEFTRKQEAQENLEKMETSKKELEAQIEKLKNEAADAYLQYGEDHPTTELLTDMLGMVLEIQGTMTQLSSFMTVMSCIGEMVGYINGALGYMDQIRNLGNQEKRGWWARQKRKFQTAKMRKNIVGGIKMIVNDMYGMSLTVEEMRDEFGKLTDEMKKMRYKMAIKRQKAQAKKAKKKNAVPEVESSSAMEIVKGLVAKRTGKTVDTGTDDGDTTPPTKGTGNGVGDISDITGD